MFCAASVVYQNSWLGQTGAITGTNVFTATSSGLYRISLGGYVDCTSGSGAVNLNSFTTLSISVSGSPNWNTLENLRYIAAGGSVSFGTTITGSPVIDHYDAYLTIEQVG